MSKLDEIVKLAYSQLGEPYSSMGNMFAGNDGWGCAMLCAACYNSVLGTNFYGSCYNFAGDICNGEPNQDYQFNQTDSPVAGDIVLYYQNYDIDNNYNCGHAAIYVGDGNVIGAWGQKRIGEIGNWGEVSETSIDYQSIGGTHIFIHCVLCDDGDCDDRKYIVNCDYLNVRDDASIHSNIVSHYERGDTVILEDWRTVNDGYVWGRYVGANSGQLRYIAIGPDTGNIDPDDFLVKL